MKKNYFNWLLLSGFLLFSLGFFANFYLARQLVFDEMHTLLQSELTSLQTDLKPLLSPKLQLNKIKPLIGTYTFSNEGYCFLADRKGTILTASDTASFTDRSLLLMDKKDLLPQLLKTDKIVFHSLGQGSTSRLAIGGRIPGTSYSVSVVLPYSGFFKPIQDFTFTLFLIWFISFLLLWFIIIWARQKFYFLFTRLKNYLQRIGLGEELSETDTGLEYLPYFKDELLNLNRVCKHPENSYDYSSLTGLPGNNELQKRLFQLIDLKTPMAVCYADIDNFTSFNQKYGFNKGDSVIRLLGLLITNSLQEFGQPDDLAVHLGADRFVFITSPAKVDAVCSGLIENFDRELPLYYPEEDRKRGYIVSKNRQGEIQKFPFLSLSVAVVTNEKRALIHPLQIGKTASEIRHFLESKQGSNYLKDRRVEDREGIREEKPEENPPA